MNYYHEDILKIVNACAKNGLHITEEQALRAWSDYSDLYAANWLILEEDDKKLTRIIKDRLKLN